MKLLNVLPNAFASWKGGIDFICKMLSGHFEGSRRYVTITGHLLLLCKVVHAAASWIVFAGNCLSGHLFRASQMFDENDRPRICTLIPWLDSLLLLIAFLLKLKEFWARQTPSITWFFRLADGGMLSLDQCVWMSHCSSQSPRMGLSAKLTSSKWQGFSAMQTWVNLPPSSDSPRLRGGVSWNQWHH